MRALLFAAALLRVSCCLAPAWAQYEDPVETTVTVTSVNASAVGTCADGTTMLLDLNGLIRCGATSTTDPQDVIVRSGACYELDATCAAPDLHIFSGIDTHQFTTVTQANCEVGATARVSAVDNTGAAIANCDCVVGTSWICITDDGTCAAGLATCVTACAAISAQSSTNTVGVRPDNTTLDLTLSMPVDAAGVCAGVSNGSQGTASLNGLTVALDAAGGNDEIALATGATTITGTAVITGTLDQRGAISNSTANLLLNDNVELAGQTLLAAGRDFATMTSTTLLTGGTTLSGRVINNIGAVARANLTLDDAPSGRSYHWGFLVLDTDGIKIIASTGDTITLGGAAVGAANGYICSTTVPSSAFCFGIIDERWYCEITGTWSQDADCP